MTPGRSNSSKAEKKRNSSNLTTMSQKPSQKNLSPTRGLNFINPQIHGSHVLELMPTSQSYFEDENRATKVKFSNAPKYTFSKMKRSLV